MLFYEVKITYTRQTGEDNPGSVKETYLVEGLTMSDIETRLLDEITPYISAGESEIQGCKKTQYFDIFPDPNAEHWYKGRVEMITIDGEKETRKAVSILVAANTLLEAGKILQQKLAQTDCEIISIAKSPILDVLRAIK